MAVKAPYLPYESLRAVADKFLEEHHPSGKIPIPIERIVEFGLGIDIVPMPGLQDEFDVDAYISSDLTEIRVDRFIQEHRSTRYRFSLAHEVAHLLVHASVFEELKFSTIAEWKAVMSSIPEEEYSWIEWQGYALAGLILVPNKPLTELFEQKLKDARRAGIELQDIDPEARRIVESNMAKSFDVSAEVIARRMNKDKLWK